MRLEKLRLIKRSLLQVNPLIPIHLQLGSMADDTQVHDILERVSLVSFIVIHKLPNSDYSQCGQVFFTTIVTRKRNFLSLAINEQELTFVSKVGGGPFNERYPISAGTLHAYKVP